MEARGPELCLWSASEWPQSCPVHPARAFLFADGEGAAGQLSLTHSAPDSCRNADPGGACEGSRRGQRCHGAGLEVNPHGV